MSPRRTRVLRYMLLVVGCLGGVLLFLLATASANDAHFSQQLNLLVVLNGLMREFPNGVLTQEREALTIEALLGSGERERARSLALEFLRLHPNSPLAASVRRALD